jgi:release factor glutamine methyltransferase
MTTMPASVPVWSLGAEADLPYASAVGTALPSLGVVTERLAAAGCVAAAEEAAEFLSAAPDAPTLELWLRRRERGEPPGWIIGVVEFAGVSLSIGPEVYVPRVQTEVLARYAADLLPVGGLAIDICTGCGAVAAYLKKVVSAATVIGVELDQEAAQWARRNGVPVLVSDLAEGVRGCGRVDVVTAVAPYVPQDEIRWLPADVQKYEPRRALDGGADGLRLVRRIVESSRKLLRRGGWLLMELGGDQDLAVSPMLATRGFDSIRPWRDEDGDLRGVAARAGW